MDRGLTGNFDLMREMNTKLILRVIRRKSPISRSEIVEETNLTAATVSRITSRLLEYGLIQETGYGASQGGRKPILLELNLRSMLVLGIDIEIDEIIGVIIDLNGKVIHRKEVDNQHNTGQQHIINLVKDTIDYLLKTKDYGVKIIGIGIGMHGLVDYFRGVSVFTPAFGWSNVPVAALIEEEFGIPVILENNVRALTLGEKWFGSALNFSNFICIKVGEGIGSGIFTNGALYRGTSNSAGEIGHTTVDDDGGLCSCGNYGCLESMASIPALISRTRKTIKQGAESLIIKLVDGNLEAINAEIIFRAAREGDLIAQQLLRDTGRFLGIGIANTINMLNPEAVIIAGEITDGGELVLDTIREVVDNRTLEYPLRHVKIIKSFLGRDGVAIGAGTLILQSLFQLGLDGSLKIDLNV
jgi:glucokinase-like ROK family protein